MIRYTATATAPRIENGSLALDLPMSASPATGFDEIWPATGEVESGELGGVYYAHDKNTVLCAAYVPYQDEYRRPVFNAYSRAFDVLEQLGYPTIFRMWNSIGEINGNNHQGLEVYRDFCLGRALAFDEQALDVTQAPAATGIGARERGVWFYLLATSRQGVTNIENPVQISAYSYPDRYGPRAPQFARASFLPGSAQEEAGTIYVSGTASIRGHQSVNIGDLEAQVHTSMENIAGLVSPENLLKHGVPGTFGLAAIRSSKVYVRHDADLPKVRDLLGGYLPAGADVAYFPVDICRSDLLVEIEAIMQPVGP
ncbi:FkbO/Hyg5 family chorismatase [Nocardiopsis ansamitocini]|nr:FkbO/Hyg5 family chorismatase [Nocardiopsis ansamitocini]